MHFNTAQSRSAWTEQEDELLRQAVAKFGDRAWATVANDVPGRSSKSCSDRWRNFLSPDIEHPRKSPFTEWEVAVVVQAQHRYGNNWKAISMLLPGRTNRAVKNLFVGNLKWGARLPEIKNRWLECNMSLEELLEIKPDHAGGPVKIRNGSTIPAASGSPSSIRAASTSSAGSAWASDITDQPLSGSPASAGTHHGGDRRKRGDGTDMHMGMAAGQSPPLSKRRRGVPSPVMPPHHHHLQHGAASYSPTVVPHPGALGPGASGSPMLGMPGLAAGDMAGLVGSMGPPAHSHHGAHGLGNNAGMLLQGHALHVMDEGSSALAAGAYGRTPGAASLARSMAGAGIPGLPSVLMAGQQQQQQQQQHLMGHMGMGWHGAMAAAAASGTSGSSSPFAAMAQQPMAGMPQLPAAAFEAQHHQGNMLAAHPGAVAPKSEPMMYEAGDCSNMGGYAAQQQPWDAMAHLPGQQQQMHPQQHHHMDMQQHHQQHQQQHHQQHHQQHMHMQQHQQQQSVSAGGVHSASAAAGLAALGLPGSPGLAGTLLQDMRSNDSAMLQQMLEQIFDADDDVMSDPHTINKFIESGDTGSGQQQEQQQQQHANHMHANSNPGQQEQHQQSQQYQQQSAGGAPPASLQAMAATADSSLAPASLMRSSTWPNSWPEGAPGPDGVAAGTTAATAAVPPAASTPASFSHTPSHHPSGMPLPPRSASATGSGLAAFPGPEGCQAPPAGWTWGPVSAGHSLPGSGPPSTGGGMPPQPHLHVICHQLQQENIKLMQRVHTLQNRLNSSGEQLPTAAELGICLPGDQQAAETPAAPAPTPAGGCGVACVPTPALAGGSLASDPAPGQAAAQQAMMQLSPVNAAAVNSSYPADNDLPRLPPVATRVGGSAGGAGHGGWATGGLDSRGSGLAGLGSGGLGLGSGSSGLGGLKVELQVSPDGSFTPGQLLEGCMVDALISDDL